MNKPIRDKRDIINSDLHARSQSADTILNALHQGGWKIVEKSVASESPMIDDLEDPPELPPLTETTIPQAWFATVGGGTSWDAEDAADVLLAHARNHRGAVMRP